MKNTIIIPALITTISILYNKQTIAQTKNEVKISGAMRNVMQKGDLSNTIHLDTIAAKQHLYGLGPLENLKGELLIIDGKSYISTVNDDGSIQMQQTYDAKAPFFVYSQVEDWSIHTLPDTILTMQQLEQYIDTLSKDHQRPFAFKLEGTFKHIDYHIQNLPLGTIIRSPKDAHQNQGKYTATNEKGSIVGFFSTTHQRIFTHHDTYIHMHYINDALSGMGHIDDITFDGNSNITLYLPKQ
jgi:acetolactate decarboxylase